MPTEDRDFQLGLLPEKQWNWRTFAASYSMVTALVLLLIFFGILMPGTLLLTNYHDHRVSSPSVLAAGTVTKAASGSRQVAA